MKYWGGGGASGGGAGVSTRWITGAGGCVSTAYATPRYRFHGSSGAISSMKFEVAPVPMSKAARNASPWSVQGKRRAPIVKREGVVLKPAALPRHLSP